MDGWIVNWIWNDEWLVLNGCLFCGQLHDNDMALGTIVNIIIIHAKSQLSFLHQNQEHKKKKRDKHALSILLNTYVPPSSLLIAL